MKTDKDSFAKADKTLNRIKQAAAAIAGILVAGRAVRGFQRIITETTAAADAVAKTSQKLGVGAQALQEYQFAAQLSGVNVRTFNMGLQRFTRRAAEAANGTGEAKDALRQMGIQLKDNQGRLRPSEDLLLDVADAISNVSDEGEKVRLAFKLFDSEGVSLINMLQGGSAGLQKMRKEAVDTGGIFSGKFMEASVEFNDQMAKMNRGFLSIKIVIVEQLLPVIVSLMKWFQETSKAVADFMRGTKMLHIILGALVGVVSLLAFMLSFKLLAVLGELPGKMIKFALAADKAGKSILLLQLKSALMGIAFLALAVIIALVAEEIVGAFTGADTLFGKVSDKLEDVYDWFIKLGEGKPIIEALLIPIKVMAATLEASRQFLFAIITMLTGGGLAGFGVAFDKAKADWEKIRASFGRVTGLGIGAAAGVQPSPQAAATAGAVTSSQQVTVNQTINATPGQSPEAVGQASSEFIKNVVHAEYRKALQVLLPARSGI
jgi:hypothetical protein